MTAIAEKVELAFVVLGHPQGKGSKRAQSIRKTTGEYVSVVIESNRNARPWATRITEKAREVYAGPLLRGPVAVTFAFCFSRPKGHYGTGRNSQRLKPSAPYYMTTTPDADKLGRNAADALIGVVINDDAQIVRLELMKTYDEPERVEVKVSEL